MKTQEIQKWTIFTAWICCENCIAFKTQQEKITRNIIGVVTILNYILGLLYVLLSLFIHLGWCNLIFKI